MAVIDKNQAMVDYLMQMDYIKDNPLFFNFINASSDNKQFVTLTDDISLNRKYIDGSELKRYSFNVIDYKSISYNPLVTMPGYSNENMDELMDVQSIIDWITEQDELRNFPNFGADCEIQSIEALSNQPALNGVDTSVTPVLAKYSISIRVTYLDTSKTIFK